MWVLYNYTVLFSVFLTINIGIGTAFIYFHIFIGILKRIIFLFNLMPILKQQIIKPVKGKYQTKKH